MDVGGRSGRLRSLRRVPAHIVHDRFLRSLTLITGFAALLRIWLGIRYANDPGPNDDGLSYLRLGREWATGVGPSSSAHVSAGYPLFLGAVEVVRANVLPVTDSMSHAVAFAQAFVGAATVATAGWLGRAIAGPAAGIGAAAALAVWPNHAIAGVPAIAEVPTSLLILLVVTILATDRHPRAGRLVVAGALIALATEMRSGCLALVVLFLCVDAGGAGVRRRLRSLAIGAGATFVVILPFAVRSSHVARTFVPLDLRAGPNLCLGQVPEALRLEDLGPCRVPPGASGLEANRIQTRKAMELIRQQPGRQPTLIARSLRDTLLSDDDGAFTEVAGDPPFTGAVRISTLMSETTLVLAALGSVLAFVRRSRSGLLVAAAAVAVTVPVLVSLGLARYRMPATPLAAVLAAAAVAWTVEGARGRWREREATSRE